MEESGWQLLVDKVLLTRVERERETETRIYIKLCRGAIIKPLNNMLALV